MNGHGGCQFWLGWIVLFGVGRVIVRVKVQPGKEACNLWEVAWVLAVDAHTAVCLCVSREELYIK